MKLRVARHTNDLDKIEAFYINILGFERLGGFQNHNNYDGVFIGKSKNIGQIYTRRSNMSNGIRISRKVLRNMYNNSLQNIEMVSMQTRHVL